MRLRRDKNGFVLIGVVWLMLLCTALVAIIMLRARDLGQAAAAEAVELQSKLDGEAAIETVAADLLIGGARSRWWQIPTEGNVGLDGRTVRVRITDDIGRMDLNTADPVLIGRALQGIGITAREREEFLSELTRRRRISSSIEAADAMALLGRLSRSTGVACLPELFTIASGLAAPDQVTMPRRLSAALGEPDLSQSVPMRSGDPLRIEVSAAGGGKKVAILRVLPANPPVQFSVSLRGDFCT